MVIEAYSHSQRKDLSPGRWGFELEVEVKAGEGFSRHGIAKRFDVFNPPPGQGENPLKLKHDGSLINGFEIVAKPLPVAEMKELLKKVAAVAMRKGRLAAEESPRCGFHLHLGVELFDNALQLQRFLNCFQNVTVWKKLIVPVAGRDANRYSKKVWPESVKWRRPLESVYFLPSHRDEIKRHGDGKLQAQLPSRFYSVNLDNRNTVEVRICKATLNPLTLLARVELVEFLLAFAKQPVSKTPVAFVLQRMLKARDAKAKWPHLLAYMKAHKLWCFAPRGQAPTSTTHDNQHPF